MIVRPRITALASYTLFALEALADELQDPFGVEPNDLPLEALAWTIEATLREMIDERVISDEPVAVQPVLTRVPFPEARPSRRCRIFETAEAGSPSPGFRSPTERKPGLRPGYAD
jgi:hypothetical protein